MILPALPGRIADHRPLRCIAVVFSPDLRLSRPVPVRRVQPVNTPDSTPSSSAAALRHVRPDLLRLAPYTPGEQVGDCIKLNTNECPWGPSPAVMEALAAVSADRLRLYPDPVARALRETAAAVFGVDPAEVLAGNGSDDCLTMVYRTFTAPGDLIACPSPTYGLYETLAGMQGAVLAQLDYRVEGRDWLLPDSLCRRGAKLVIVANPNNPSGTLAPIDGLRRLADELDGVLVVDEAYIDFAETGGGKASMLPYLGQHPNLIVLRTFSKSYSLAGARLGLLFAHAPVVDQLMKVKDSYNVNVITQALGKAALDDRAYHLDLVQRTVAERRRLEAAFADFGWAWPVSAANFLLCDVGPHAERLYRGLKERGILVRWWNRPALSSKLRITVGRPDDNDRLLAALRELGA
jgi:histidinol-phosphate aminotransferase